MPQIVFFVHGGGESAFDEDAKLVDSLRKQLGSGYTVAYPQMPDPSQPTYDAWKEAIMRSMTGFSGGGVLVGHSFGASILLKILAEEDVPATIKGVFLIATPFWGTPDWEADAYALQDNFADQIPATLPIFLYHSRDDDVVPFEHLAMYGKKLPQATIREFNGRGHQFNNDLSDVARDIISPKGDSAN